MSWLDYALGIITLISLITRLLAEWGRLPPNVRRWLRALDEQEVLRRIEQAAVELADKTPEERRRWVQAALRQWALDRTGIEIPDHVLNAIIEYVYARWRARRR